MTNVFVTWIVVFSIAALLARGAAWQVAFQLTIPFPSYDEEEIYKRVKGRVFTRFWLFSTAVSSSVVAIGMTLDEAWMLVLSTTGIGAIVVVTTTQGYWLFREALREMGLPWPPSS